MKEIVIDKGGTVNNERLSEELEAAMRGKYRGLRVKTQENMSHVTVYGDDSVTQAEERTVQETVEAHRPEDLSAQQAMVKNIRDTAAGAAGVALVDLTAGQIKALMACLLYKAGGVTGDGKVAPLGDWLK